METGYKVGEVMTHKPIVLGKDAGILDCVQIMNKHHVGAILVTEKNKPSGIITEADLVHKIIGKNKLASRSKVKDIMEAIIATATPEIDIFEALIKMRDLNIRHLPIVEENKLVGLLTLKDILKIQPQLFEIIAKKFELREEKQKPINRINQSEGICNLCGEYSEKLTIQDGVAVCDNCKDL